MERLRTSPENGGQKNRIWQSACCKNREAKNLSGGFHEQPHSLSMAAYYTGSASWTGLGTCAASSPTARPAVSKPAGGAATARPAIPSGATAGATKQPIAESIRTAAGTRCPGATADVARSDFRGYHREVRRQIRITRRRRHFVRYRPSGTGQEVRRQAGSHQWHARPRWQDHPCKITSGAKVNTLLAQGTGGSVPFAFILTSTGRRGKLVSPWLGQMDELTRQERAHATEKHCRATLAYGASINSIFPSRVRCSTITFPWGSRKTNTSRSRKCASLIASSSVMGRLATASWGRSRWTSVDLATAGNLCTTIASSPVSARPTAVGKLSCAPLPFHFLCSWRFLLRQRVLYLTACFSRCSSASLTADFMSPAWATPTRGPLRGLIVISAL